ncbi:hypothetical protein TRFO_18391 [Tritrichomonas foetus]|uniref:Calcineurin-like phosphoesterase domain-containing protein n=1 Tax=Tritrichomonas foetus TaxID=1144522 RepID=A0A1J4KQF7_9EUKA|nr:hypothetical protein TRFO_18391 [Tritrichomonas foetus]|eukprot:OHT11926.1 hypothetical protein TRFO_18391 [Tritrichomonas foetus]
MSLGDSFLFKICTFLLLFLLPFSCLIPRYVPQKTPTFYSNSQNIKKNHSSSPVWFLHVSDFHLSADRPDSYHKIKRILNYSINKFRPHKIIITGDLTDNRGKFKMHPYRGRVDADWALFDRLLTELNLKKEEILAVFGNHDVYSLEKEPHDFNQISSEIFFDQESNISVKFIKINPYRFPSPPIAFLRKVFPTKSFLKSLKETVNSANDCDFSFLICHNPKLRFMPINSLEKATFGSQNLKFLLTGHWHPKSHSFLHMGNTLEVVSPALFKKEKIGLITVYKGNCVYHPIDFENEEESHIFSQARISNIKNHQKSSFLLSPCPIEQITSFDSFFDKNEEVKEIRAISFQETMPNLSIKGDINGKLECQKTKKQNLLYYLCSFKYEIENDHKSIYTFERIGDWEGKVSIPMNSAIESFEEIPYVDYPAFAFIPLYFYIFLVFSFLLFNNFSIFLSPSTCLITNKKIFKIHIFTEEMSYCSNIYPKTIKIKKLLLVFLFYTCNFFLVGYKVESTFCFLFWFGIISFKPFTIDFHFHFIGSQYLVYLLVFVIFPFILSYIFYLYYYRSINYRNIDKIVIIILLISISISISFLLKLINKIIDLLGLFSAVTSPAFCLFPILIIIQEICFITQLARIFLQGNVHKDEEIILP